MLLRLLNHRFRLLRGLFLLILRGLDLLLLIIRMVGATPACATSTRAVSGFGGCG